MAATTLQLPSHRASSPANPLFWRWSQWLGRSLPRNQVLLLECQLLVPERWTDRYRPGKTIRLRFSYDAELDLARVLVWQGCRPIAQLPLPEAQKLYAWRKSGSAFSYRLLEEPAPQTGDAQLPQPGLQLRVTYP